MSNTPNSDLQRLLANLNGYIAPTPPTSKRTYGDFVADSQNVHCAVTHQSASIPGLGFLPPEPLQAKNLPLPSSNTPVQSTVPRTRTPQPSTKTPPPPPPPKASIPDASLITTWPAALKHITKHLAPSSDISTRIRHLIASQHKHEREWHSGRQALITLQESRSGTSAQVSALLASLNGTSTSTSTSPPAPTPGPAEQTPETKQKELDAYDAKVYKSLLALSADFDRQLRALGIPFFAIKHELVILEDGKEKPGASWERLDKGELRELQRRMLGYLEDLFGDEGG